MSDEFGISQREKLCHRVTLREQSTGRKAYVAANLDERTTDALVSAVDRLAADSITPRVIPELMSIEQNLEGIGLGRLVRRQSPGRRCGLRGAQGGEASRCG